MFDLRSLRYFVAAYEERSITRAARRCAISQPSVTAGIQNLEAALGAVLLERSRAGLTPTRKGEVLYRRATALLSEATEMMHDVRTASGRRVALSIQSDIPMSIAAPVIQEIYALDRSIALNIVDDSDRAQIRLGASHYAPPDLPFFPLWEEFYMAFVPDTHPLRFRNTISLKDLDGVALVERPTSALGLHLDRHFRNADIRPDVRARAPTEDGVLELVALGVGLAIGLAGRSYRRPGIEVRRLEIDQPMKRVVGLSCTEGAYDLAVSLAERLAETPVDVGSASNDPQPSLTHHEIVAFDRNLTC